MDLCKAIMEKYPELKDTDFNPTFGCIELRDEGDGPFIYKWEHPTLAQPSDAELGITRKPE